MVVKYCPSTSDGVTTNYGANANFSCDDCICRIRSQNIPPTGQIPEGSHDTPSTRQQKERHQKKDPLRDEIPCVGLHRFAHFKRLGNNCHTHKQQQQQREFYPTRDASLIRRVTIGRKRKYPVGFSDCTAFPKLRVDFSSFLGDICKRALPRLLHWPPNDLDSLGFFTLLDFKQIAFQPGGRVAPTTTVVRARSENSLTSTIVATSSTGRSSSAGKASFFSLFLPSSASSTDVTIYDDLGRFLKLDVGSNILHVSVSASPSSSTTTTTTTSSLLILQLLLLLIVEDNFPKSTLIDVGDSESDLRHRQREKLLLFIRAGVLDSDALSPLLLQLLLLLSLLSVYSARSVVRQKITPKMNAPIRSRPIRRTNSMKMSGRIRITTTTTTSTSSSSNNDGGNDNGSDNGNDRRNLANISDYSTSRLESGCRCTYMTDNTVSSDVSNCHHERNPFPTAPSEFWPVYNCSTPYNNHLRARTCNNTININNDDDCNNKNNTNNNNKNNNVQIVNNRKTILSKFKPRTTTTKTDFGTTQENSPTNPNRVVRFFIYLTYMWWSFLTRLHSCTGPLDTCHRTGSSTGSSTRKQGKYVLLTINMLALFTCAAGQCKVSTCQTQWPSYQMNSMDVDLQSDSYKCRALRTTLHCIRKVSHGCVGNIDYHSEKSRIQKQMSRSKCSTVGDIYETVDHTHRPQVQRPQPECLYKGKGSYKHCGLFGDPHLRTFNRVCQTCKIRGAWPLVDNNRLTVMVTNKPVMVDGTATATVMLTVRIRRNELCGSHHFVTYETQANHLPSTFDDGRTHYGPGNGIELKVLEPNKHIKIHIKYIDTTILIRQIGRYFTFALWMPEEMVDESNGNTPELCVRGCPKSEQINYQEFLAQKHQQLMQYKTQNKLVMGRLEAETLCRQSKVVDFYFDSCVFDLMTTGDRNFTVAAYSALHDLLKLNPEVAKSNKNRTDFQRYDQRFSGSTSTRTLQIMQRLTLVFMTLFSSSVCSWL